MAHHKTETASTEIVEEPRNKGLSCQAIASCLSSMEGVARPATDLIELEASHLA